jgi:hypothetical protein
MIEDAYLISLTLIFTSIGALGRVLFGISKVFNSTVDLHWFLFNMRRVGVEMVVSMLLGTLGMITIIECGWAPPAMSVKGGAILCGLLGPDILKFITKKLGISKAFDIRFTDQQVALAEFNPRQIAALEYMKKNKIITNSVYQEINQTSQVTAKRDLMQLARKKKVKKVGNGKGTYYKSA